MKLLGEYRFASRREEVWEALLDADTLSRCLPGFERLERVGDNEYEGALELKVGPVQGKFRGRLSLADLEPPSGYSLTMKGQGAAGFVDGRGSLRLVEESGVTVLHYDVDTQVGGKIAGVGQRLLESSARSLSEQALSELERQIGARTDDASRAVVPEGPTQAEFAARVAKDVARDLVPPRRRPLVVVGALVILVVVLAVLIRSCGA